MKTSVLIKKLTEIDNTVPFDADVVSADSNVWDLSCVKRVYHEPPHTYIEFDSSDPQSCPDEDNRIASINELRTKAGYIDEIRDMIETNKCSTIEQVLHELETLSNRMKDMADHI